MSSYINNNTLPITGTTGTLGTAAGLTIYVNGPAPAYLNSAIVSITTSATVGNRSFSYAVRDASGNNLWIAPSAVTVAASATANIEAGSGVSVAGIMNSLPVPCFIPPNGSVAIFDTGNISTADNVTASRLVVQF